MSTAHDLEQLLYVNARHLEHVGFIDGDDFYGPEMLPIPGFRRVYVLKEPDQLRAEIEALLDAMRKRGDADHAIDAELAAGQYRDFGSAKEAIAWLKEPEQEENE